MKTPALAVVGADHRIIRSTESFRRRYEGAETLCRQSAEVERVLTGRADAAVVSVGDMNVEIEAVMDAAGRRHAMLSLPPDERASNREPPVTALRDAADESPAMVWVKDLEGRYLYANPRYLRDLGTSEDRLRGNTDADLPEAETVDGPRLRYAEDGLKEPLQLEYTVPAIDGRSALAAFRFPLRDDRGQPIATCGVAAPTNEAQVARDEAVRLMQLERWNRLDPVDVRAELLEQWHVQAAPPRPDEELAEAEGDSPGESEVELEVEVETASPDDEVTETEPEDSQPQPVNSGQVEVQATPSGAEPPGAPEAAAGADPSAAELLQNELELARKWADRADQLQGDLQQAQARVRDAESDAQQALAAAARAAEETARARGELEQTRLELEQTQRDLESAQTEADTAWAGAEAARGELETVRAEAEATRGELGTARAELEAARGELGTARAELEATRGEMEAARAEAASLRGPSAAALRLSEELGRALASERERGDELERTLARLQARLTDFETAFDLSRAPEPSAV